MPSGSGVGTGVVARAAALGLCSEERPAADSWLRSAAGRGAAPHHASIIDGLRFRRRRYPRYNRLGDNHAITRKHRRPTRYMPAMQMISPTRSATAI
jgi:hypothetical protein